jgi:hypothetical protein
MQRDTFVVHVTDKGMPQQGVFPLRALFINLTPADLRSEIVIVARVYRVGALDWENRKKVRCSRASRAHTAASPTAAALQNDKGHQFRRPWGCSVHRIGRQDVDKLILTGALVGRALLPAHARG